MTDRKRRRSLFAVGLCVVAVVAVVILGFVLSGNVVYYRTVTEAVNNRVLQGDARFRIAGAVVPGSVVETKSGVDFAITDGKSTVMVAHKGDPPELFKANAPVVCEGLWGKGKDFDSDRIMIRHGNEYQPPKVDTDRAPKAS